MAMRSCVRTEHLVNVLNMSSGSQVTPGDLTAKATIRNTALRLFADRGPDAVTVRDVAAAAGVSPGLVMHHFGSKAGLREAVDEHVAHSFDAVLDALTDDGLEDALTGGDSTSLAEAFVAGFPPGSPLPEYLRRMLLTNDPTGDRVFARWFAESERVLAGLEAAGIADRVRTGRCGLPSCSSTTWQRSCWPDRSGRCAGSTC